MAPTPTSPDLPASAMTSSDNRGYSIIAQEAVMKVSNGYEQRRGLAAQLREMSASRRKIAAFNIRCVESAEQIHASMDALMLKLDNVEKLSVGMAGMLQDAKAVSARMSDGLKEKAASVPVVSGHAEELLAVKEAQVSKKAC